ncbi:MAG: hypothetical protein RLZZ595_1469 [Bacteroidota bacterium]|jgi:hypothetical protein
MKRYSREEMDDLLKEKSDQYLLYPSDSVWKNIHKELHPNNGWRYASIALLLLFSATVAVFLKKEEIAKSNFAKKETAYQFIEIPSVSLLNPQHGVMQTQKPIVIRYTANRASNKSELGDKLATTSIDRKSLAFQLPQSIATSPAADLFSSKQINTAAAQKEEKKNSLAQTLDLVVEKAKNISKNIRWQVYGGPSIGYRRLKGEATRSNYQYSVYSLSTNAVYARDVKDAVNHKPAMGFEIGTSMFYPLNKRLNLKLGVQANYNEYQILAYSAIPEIATYSVNNARPGAAPISAVSIYRNNEGLSPAKLRNEHYMLSLPIGLDYRVAGNNKLNFSVASTIQPTYVFANYSYLLSTNLRNYAKEPSLNRNWNINGAVEASLNFEQGGYKWSIAPQFRYQMLSSFKDKYPIKENLMDMGIKVGIIKTIN